MTVVSGKNYLNKSKNFLVFFSCFVEQKNKLYIPIMKTNNKRAKASSTKLRKNDIENERERKS